MEETKLVKIDGEWRKVPLDFRHPGLDILEKKAVAKEKREAFKEAEAQVPKTCGNCRSIRYSGIHETTRQMGWCSKNKESGRGYVKPDFDSCPLWSRRTDYKMKIELERSASLINKARSVKSSTKR